MMRLAVIAEDLQLPLDEGAKKTAFLLIRSLIKTGLQVSVFTQSENPLLPDARQLPKNKFLFGVPFLRQLHQQAPDVILYIPESSGTVGAFIRASIIKMQSAGVPVGLLNLQFRGLPPAARYLGLQRSVAAAFTQSSASRDVLQAFGCSSVLLPGGVDSTVFHPVDASEKALLRAQYGFSETDQLVLHVGHLKRDRNVIKLIRLAEAGFRVVLIASTTTPADPALQAELERAGVQVIRAYIENIQHYYQLADCYFFPVVDATSAIDAPLSVLEAMACNIPVVTTSFGVLPTMFHAGNGLYFYEAEEDIVSLVRKAIHDPDCKTCEMAAPYSWDNLALAMLETLKKVGNR